MTDIDKREYLKLALMYSRRDFNKSQQEMAGYVGVTKKTISNWEIGKGCPDAIQLNDWFNGLGLPLNNEYTDKILNVSNSSLYSKYCKVQKPNIMKLTKMILLYKSVLYMLLGKDPVNEDNEIEVWKF